MAEPVRVFRHVLLTRFNTRRPDFPGAAPDEAWLRSRWTLFERYCVPSVARQTARDFEWLVFFDAATPENWRGRVTAAAAAAAFRPVYLDEPFTGGAAAAAISALGLDDAPFLITSRLDNDDALAPHYVAELQRAYRPRELEFLNFPLGYQLAAGRLYLRPYVASSFASLVEQVGDRPVRTVHFTEHHLIGRHPVRQLWAPPAWLQVVHGANLANEVRGIPVAGRAAAERFALTDVTMTAPSPAARTAAVVRFALRGISTGDARTRARSVLRRRTAAGTPDRAAPEQPAFRPARVTAILTCHNRRDLTVRALTGWFGQQGHGARLDAVLVDDGSTDGTGEAVRQLFPDVRVIRGDGSLFWARGMAVAEAAARRSDPDALVWLNDDVVLAEDCLAALLETAAGSTPPAVVAGALTDPTTGRPTYGAVESSRWHPLRTRLLSPSGTPHPVGAVHGNVLLVPRPAYLAARGIDGDFAHAYADFDYGLRLRTAGYPVLLTPGTVGTCSRATSSRSRPATGSSLAERLRALNSPRGLPLRSHARYLRRHGGRLWPVLAVAPYLKLVVRATLAPRQRPAHG